MNRRGFFKTLFGATAAVGLGIGKIASNVALKRRIRAMVTVEAQEDLRGIYALDTEEELARVIAQEIQEETDREIIRDIIRQL
jgi:hypothetical protein